MKNDCKNCEAENLNKYADLTIKYERLEKYKKLLEQSLDIKEELNKTLREENEELKNKLFMLER